MNNHAVTAITTIVLLVAMWQSGAITIASIYTLRGERVLNAGADIDSQQNQAIRLFDQAMDVDSRHPGPVYDVVKLTKISRRSDDIAKQGALQLHRRLVLIRPASAENWARLFALKSDLGGYDAEWLDAFVRAEQIGPWEPVAIYYLLEAGTGHWLGLIPAMRESIINVAVRALVSASANHGRSIDLLKARGFLQMACSAVMHRGQRSVHCPATDTE